MKNSGFSLVEILVAVALVAIFIPAVATVFSLSLQSSSQGEKFTQAYSFAQQEMENIFYQKGFDPSWQWTATSDTSSPILNTSFTRRIQIAEAYRCGSDFHLCDCTIIPTDPDCPGVIDNESRKIIVRVTWPEKSSSQQVMLEAYVTKH